MQNIREGLGWLKSQIDAFINYLSPKINEAYSRAKRFFDNLPESLVEAFIEAKNKFEQQLKNTATYLSNLRTSTNESEWNLIAGLLRDLFSCVGAFFEKIKEIAAKTLHKLKIDDLFKVRKVGEVKQLIKGNSHNVVRSGVAKLSFNVLLALLLGRIMDDDLFASIAEFVLAFLDII